MTGAPAHPFITGVMVKLTVAWVLPGLLRVPLMLPDPFAGMPVTVKLSLTQFKTAPAVVLDGMMVLILLCEQIVWVEEFTDATAVGLTTTVAVDIFPGHPLAVPVILIVTVCGSVPLFAKLPLMFVVPDIGMAELIPTGLSLVQVKLVPEVALLNTILLIAALLHTF